MEQLVNFIIRPPRADYSPKDDLLDQEFMLKGRWFQRKDLEAWIYEHFPTLQRAKLNREYDENLPRMCRWKPNKEDAKRSHTLAALRHALEDMTTEEVINDRGNVLKCSHYVPLVIPEGKPLPCVIYCHGNSGCRADASEAAIILLPSNITLFTLDFAGSGLSEGEHVTLGWYEKDDLRVVVNHLRTDGNVSCIGLWGRSMGAVTSLMYGAEDPSIAGMVLDSPFSNLVDLMMELVDTYKYPLPKFTVKLAIQHMRKVIKKKANFDIMDLDTIQVAKCCFVPVLFGHATDDDFIRPHHSDRIYDSCVGDKNIIKFDGDHNSPRPQFYFDSISIFFHNVLSPPEDMSDEQYFHTVHDVLDRDTWDTFHGTEYGNNNASGQPTELASGSTEEAITQLRSRRPMSRTEVPPDISSLEKNECEGNEIDGPSSSSFRGSALPNGHSRTRLIPVTVDDEYVEYSFGNSSDMPSSTEDEERMIMEAIIESLKDLETKHPREEAQPNAGTAPADSSSEGVQVSPAELPEPSSQTVSSTPTAEQKPETTVLCAATAESSSNNKSNSTGNTTAGSSINSKSNISGNTSEDAQSDDCGSTSTQQNANMADGTRATLVVQKNSSSQVVEGLAQRWRLNFFKNNR